jgi:autophagy-related protein 2
VSTTSALTIVLTLNDISAFVLLAIPQSASQDKEVSATPILITDNNLPTQYASIHIHPNSHTIFAEGHDYPQLADFGILDWTAEENRMNSTKISTWRTKIRPKTSKRRESQTGVGVGMSSSPNKFNSIPQVASGFDAQILEQTSNPPAIVANAKFTLLASTKEQAGGPEMDNRVEVDVVPLHIYVDLGLALGGDALEFLNGVAGGDANAMEASREDDEDNSGDEWVGGIMLPSSGRKHSITEHELERQRLEKSVLEDLDLEIDYRDGRPSGKLRSSVSRGESTRKVRINYTDSCVTA